MRSLNDDLEYVNTILNGQNEEEFGFLYSRTNENLLNLFEKIDVFNKIVYTVLSSSDFLFSAVDAGVSKIDSFDINPISYRYYHLRKWLLQKNLIDADGESLSTLLYIVKNHIHSDFIQEQDSIDFWLDFMNRIDNVHFYSNILFEYIERPEVPYSNNKKELSEKLKLINPKFDYIDICSNLATVGANKYDLVYLSNILDYNREEQRLHNCCQNMLNLLQNNGEVICSQIQSKHNLDKELDIFSDYFKYDELFIDNGYNQKILYYKYTKKD